MKYKLQKQMDKDLWRILHAENDSDGWSAVNSTLFHGSLIFGNRDRALKWIDESLKLEMSEKDNIWEDCSSTHSIVQTHSGEYHIVVNIT